MKPFFCIIFTILFSSVSYACSCAIGATEQRRIEDLKNTNIIFYGKVISVGKEESATGEQGVRNETVRQIKFKVLRAWKGVNTEEITVVANAWDSCSVIVKAGQKFLIYINKTKVLNSLNYIDYCSLDHFDKSLLRKVYGEGEIVKPQKTSTK